MCLLTFQLTTQKPCEVDNFGQLREAMRCEFGGKEEDIISLMVSNKKNDKILKWGFSPFFKKAILGVVVGEGWTSSRFVALGTGKGPSGKNASWAQLKDWFQENVKWLLLGEDVGDQGVEEREGWNHSVNQFIRKESPLANEMRVRKSWRSKGHGKPKGWPLTQCYRSLGHSLQAKESSELIRRTLPASLGLTPSSRTHGSLGSKPSWRLTALTLCLNPFNCW